MVIRASKRWGQQVVHVGDRGEGSGTWRGRWGQSPTRFGGRWKTGNQRGDAAGQKRKAWEIARGKRVWGERQPLWETQTRTFRHTGVVALPVRHAEDRASLFLVVVRQGGGREPWDLLTKEPIETEDHVWDVVDTAVTRRKIEEPVRFAKQELHIETFRVQEEEAQRKRLMWVTLAASVVLACLAPALSSARTQLLRRWCQRADWRRERVRMPVSRLRWALFRLWLAPPLA